MQAAASSVLPERLQRVVVHGIAPFNALLASARACNAMLGVDHNARWAGEGGVVGVANRCLLCIAVRSSTAGILQARKPRRPQMRTQFQRCGASPDRSPNSSTRATASRTGRNWPRKSPELESPVGEVSNLSETCCRTRGRKMAGCPEEASSDFFEAADYFNKPGAAS
jgi:hypothetical protein